MPTRVFRVRRTCTSRNGPGFKLNLHDYVMAKDDLQSKAHGVLQRGYDLPGRDGRCFRQLPAAIIREASCIGLVSSTEPSTGTTRCAHVEASVTILPQASFYDLRDPTCPGPAVTIKGHPVLGLNGERNHYCAVPQFIRVDNTAAGVKYDRCYVGQVLAIIRL